MLKLVVLALTYYNGSSFDELSVFCRELINIFFVRFDHHTGLLTSALVVILILFKFNPYGDLTITSDFVRWVISYNIGFITTQMVN